MQDGSATQTQPQSAHQANAICLKCGYDISALDPEGKCPECGTPNINGCIGCGYDLADTPSGSNCPECGIPVWCSVGRNALSRVSTQDLRTEHEEQFVTEIGPLIEDYLSEQDDVFRAVLAAENIDKMGSYLGRFLVDDTVVDMLKLAAIYKILGED